MSEELLSVEHLSVEFGSRAAPVRVIDDVSLSLPTGGSLGVVGESGSGKSITSLSILRLIPEGGRIVSGRIRLGGKDLLSLPLTAMQAIRGRDVAMIFQEPMSSLNPVMTIGDQIGEAIKLHEILPAPVRRQRVIELLGLVGMPDPGSRLGAFPHQFSGGMRQRVMIAMALACNPRLLIADEPTTALDVTIQAQVLELMKSIRARFGTAILLISHDLGIVAELCERVVVMYAGRVLEVGEARELFRRPAHPYTRGLLNSIPRLDDDRRRLQQIPGSVPPPGAARQGCPFRWRCPLRVDRCSAEMPPVFRYADGHTAACWVTAAEAGAPVVEAVQ